MRARPDPLGERPSHAGRGRPRFQSSTVADRVVEGGPAPCDDRIEAVLDDEIAAFGHDDLSILRDLQVLVMVLVTETHALADEFQDIHDAERPVALVRAEFALIGMIDRRQRIDAGITGGFELLELKLALVGGKHRQIEGLVADALTRERRVPVDGHRDHARALPVLEEILLGAPERTVTAMFGTDLAPVLRIVITR